MSLLMANVVKTEPDDSPSLYDLEYRASEDDAWYSVCVILDSVAEKLTIKYSCSPQLYEVVFYARDFETEARVDELIGRFRPISRQMQDNECLKLSVGTTVCAAHGSGDDDLRFYDAVVDAVHHRPHSFSGGEEECLCNFVIFWKHGRGRDTLTSTDIASLCFIEPVTRIDPRISDFAEMAKKKITSSKSIPAATSLALVPNGSSNDSSYIENQESPHYRPLELSDIGHKHRSLTYKTQAKISNYNQWTSQDKDIGPITDSSATADGQFFIIINNLEKDLTSSSIVDFIYEKTTILPKVCVLPRQITDPFARGAIMVDCQKKAQTIHEFLDNPNHLVVSSSGRPWVITKKPSRGSIWNLIPGSQKEIKRKATGKQLKIVVTGTEAYKKAKLLKDLIVEFLHHESQVCKRLVLAEKEILQSC